VSLFVGLLISLGASTAVSGAIAGYINTFGRVFKVGDVIKVGEVLGVVRQTRLLTTKIHTVRNEEVTIPNATITNTSLINYSTLAREGGLILQIEVGVGYGVPWRQVHAMLLEAAGRTPDLLPAPPPFVLQRELGTFAVSYVLNVRTARPDRMLLIRSVLHQNILDQFNEHGVQIMTPAYESDPRDLKVVPKERWFDAPASGS
jgi:small-conductance mechanosensitive channel